MTIQKTVIIIIIFVMVIIASIAFTVLIILIIAIFVIIVIIIIICCLTGWLKSIGSQIVYDLDCRRPVLYVIPIQNILGNSP
jgi:hypothetical protein